MSHSKDKSPDWILERCRELGFRRTKGLELIIGELSSAKKPITLGDLNDSAAIQGNCDPATVYRVLMKLEEKGLLRRLGLHDRAAHYTLRYPDQHGDYLVCKECGSIEELEMACPVEKLEKEIAEKSGFSEIDHELEFFGVCPECA